MAIAFEIDERRGVSKRAEGGARVVRQTDVGLRVRRRGGEELTIDTAEMTGVQEKASAVLAGGEEKMGVEEKGSGGAQVLIVAAPGRLPVGGHKEIQAVESGGETDDGIVFKFGTTSGIGLTAVADVSIATGNKKISGSVVDGDAAGGPVAAARAGGVIDVQAGRGGKRDGDDVAVVVAAIPQATAEGDIEIAVGEGESATLLLDGPIEIGAESAGVQSLLEDNLTSNEVEAEDLISVSGGQEGNGVEAVVRQVEHRSGEDALGSGVAATPAAHYGVAQVTRPDNGAVGLVEGVEGVVEGGGVE